MVGITDVRLYADGGTVTFQVPVGPAAGDYRLQTPWRGRPQPIFRDGVQLGFGSADEAELSAVLRDTLGFLTAEEAKGPPDESDGIPVRIGWLWRMASIPTIRYVIETLEKRQPVT